MNAIVYTSENGSTERYARALSERTGLPAYALQDAGKVLPKGESILCTWAGLWQGRFRD